MDIDVNLIILKLRDRLGQRELDCAVKDAVIDDLRAQLAERDAQSVRADG